MALAFVLLLGCQGVVTEAPSRDPAPSATCSDSADVRLRRLTPAEYLHSVEAVVGLDLASEGALLPPADPALAGF